MRSATSQAATRSRVDARQPMPSAKSTPARTRRSRRAATAPASPRPRAQREVAERGGRQPEPGAGGQHQRGEGGPPAAVDDEELAQAPQRQQGEGHPGEVDEHRPADAVEHGGGQLLDRRAGAAGQLVVPVVEPRPARPQHVGHVDVGAVPQEREGHVARRARATSGPAQGHVAQGVEARTGPAGSGATGQRSGPVTRDPGRRRPPAPRCGPAARPARARARRSPRSP